MNHMYTGTWHSTKYPSVLAHGQVRIRLKDMNIQHPTYTTSANLTYLGWYRKNQKVQLQVQVSADQKHQSEIETHQKDVAQYSQRKAAQLPSPVVKGALEFEITQQHGDTIQGTYKLNQPPDKGVFYIKRGFRAPTVNHKSQQCIVS